MADRHFISDRRIAYALDKEDGGAQLEAVRELLDEMWNRGFNAGQMKERISFVAGVSNPSRSRTW